MHLTPSARSAPAVRFLLAGILCVSAPAVAFASFTGISTNPLGQNGMGFGVSWCDYDRDGDQDLYLTYDGPNVLLRNDGGSFTDVTAPPLDDAGNGGAAVWGDYDNDGDPDLYLVNYLGTNRLFRNDGASGFADATAPPLDDTGPGQGAAWADYDLDGDLDLYLVRYGIPNRMFRNDGSAGFVDATTGPLADAGWGLAAAWGDYDHDGDSDLYLTNDGPNRLLRNDGADVFTAITDGPLGDAGNGTGVAWCDYDRDGDLDLYLVNDGSKNVLMRNDQAGGNHWLALELKGRASNRSAIGARVRVVAGALSMIEEVSGGAGYMSQNSLTLEFGLAGHALADSVTVSWPSGYEEVYRDVAADRRLTITELDVVAVEESAPAAPPLRLGAPSPNPSGGRVRLDVSLPAATPVRLEVYDVHGRRVATLIDGVRAAGRHPVSWEARDDRGHPVAAGVYWARFEALGEVRTRAIVLAR